MRGDRYSLWPYTWRISAAAVTELFLHTACCLQGVPLPEAEQCAIDAVMQYAIHRIGFPLERIALFAWSIGGYSASWAAMNYPGVKHVVRYDGNHVVRYDVNHVVRYDVNHVVRYDGNHVVRYDGNHVVRYDGNRRCRGVGGACVSMVGFLQFGIGLAFLNRDSSLPCSALR